MVQQQGAGLQKTRKGVSRLASGMLKKDCELILGDGKRIRFWEDSWCGRSPLCRVFPKLYKIVDAKGAMVADCWTETSERGAWDPKFERSFNNWELEAI